MRPTLPIDQWRIATHLEATRAVQSHPTSPATGCQCLCCRNWRLVATDVLPLGLQEQLLRFGIAIQQPSDAHSLEQTDAGAHCRIVYHVVGRLLSGPMVVGEDPHLGRVLRYREVRGRPRFLSLAVVPSRHMFGPAPVLNDPSAGEALQLDFRLDGPRHPSLGADGAL